MRNKLLNLSSKPVKTYFTNRVCQNCGKPIADQERKSRIYCPPVRDDKGKIIQDCRRQKHQFKHQPEEDFLLDYCAMQRETRKRIEAALKDHGDELTEQILTAYHIQLDTCIRHYDHGGTTVVEFLGYDIIINPYYLTLKVVKNDKSGIYSSGYQAA